MSTDIYVKGEGKGLANKKSAPKVDNSIIDNDRIIESLKQNALKKMKYTTLDTTALTSVILKDNEIFNGLKAEIERFNEEVRKALMEKRDIDHYNWRLNLYGGLRSLLKEIVAAESKELRTKLLDKAYKWFYDKLVKKDGEKALPQRPDSTAKTRPITAGTRPITAGTNLSFQNTTNISNIQKNESMYDAVESPSKSIADHKLEHREMLPSEFRAEILRDYELGARSKHTDIEPPYER